MHPAPQPARAIPADGEGAAPRIFSDDGSKLLRPYSRELDRLKTLTSEQEIGLSPAEFRERMERVESVEIRPHEVRTELTQGNLRLLIMVAKAFSGIGVSLLDGIQEGNLAVLRAVLRPGSRTRAPEDS